MSTVFELLDAEWRRLGHDRIAARRLGEVCRRAGGAQSLAEVERFVRTASAPEADQVLLALVARASVGGDGLAARVLLQLLMPGTRRMARRWWAVGDPDERAAAAVAAVYGRIRSYPLARRPGRVAANVLLDAERELRRAAAGAVITPVADPAAHLPRHRQDLAGNSDAETAPPAAVELAEVLRDAVDDRVIERSDAELIARSRIGGERVVDIAARRGSAVRTLWDRRQRAEHALVTAALHRREAAS